MHAAWHNQIKEISSKKKRSRKYHLGFRRKDEHQSIHGDLLRSSRIGTAVLSGTKGIEGRRFYPTSPQRPQ